MSLTKLIILAHTFLNIARHEEKGLAACEHLKKQGLHAPKYYQLDITDRQQIMEFRQHLQKTYGGIDVLINYASVPHKVQCCSRSFLTDKLGDLWLYSSRYYL